MSPSQLPASARHAVFAPLDGGGRSQLVARRLTDAIRLGFLVDGDQLPSEAELAGQLNVSTATLREALATLRREGLVETRRGRGGGTFVRSPAQGFEARARLRELPVDELRDAADHHAAIAAGAARLAAERGSAPDLERLRDHVERQAATTGGERARADARFHVEVAATARSTRLTRDEMAAQAALGPLLWLAVDEDAAARHLAEHRELVAAIARRDGDRAAALAAAHVRGGLERILPLRLAAPALAGAAPAPRQERARAVLAGVADMLDAIFASIEETRDALLAADARARAERRPLQRADLAQVRELAHRHLARHGALVAGTGAVCAPGLLQDAPRWLEWWTANGDSAPRRLVVGLDPEDPDFYDYETADWFAVPKRTGEPSIAGPFVDYSGTDLHIFTLTLPVADGERYLGIAGADVPVGRFAELIAPMLAGLGEEAVLVNHRGRVIAGTSPGHLSGTLVGDGEPAWLDAGAGGAALARDPRLPWALLLTG